MKNLNQRMLILMAAVMMMAAPGCKEEESPAPPDPRGGDIVFPAESLLDTNFYTVYSSIEVTAVENGTYEFDHLANYSTQLLLNEEEEIVMMGYKSPGSDAHISSTTTALALAMNTKAALLLSPTGKQQLINEIPQDPNFMPLVYEVDSALINNGKLLDTSNTSIPKLLEAIFRNLSKKRTAAEDLPVHVFQNHRKLVFSNYAKTHGSVVGVYRDGQKIDEFSLDGVMYFANSLDELINGATDTLTSDPKDFVFNLKGDGEFKFEVRTGRPNVSGGSSESEVAFYENISQFSIRMLSVGIPNISDHCFDKMRPYIATLLSDYYGIGREFDLDQNISTAIIATYDIIPALISGCGDGPSVKPAWTDNMRQLSEWLFAKSSVDAVMNMTLFGNQWSTSAPNGDVCYAADGSDVTSCGEGALPVVTEVSNYNFNPGDFLTLTGQNLKDVTDVTLKADNSQAVIISQTATSLTISMPFTSVDRTELNITNAAGSMTTTQEFVHINASFVMFTDNYGPGAYNSGVQSWSWSAAVAPAANQVKTGNKSLKVIYQGNGALSLFLGMDWGVNPPLNVTDYLDPLPKYLVFWAMAENDPATITIAPDNDGGNGSFVSFTGSTTANITANEWSYHKIDLSFIGGDRAFARLNFALNGTATIYYDDLMLVH